MNGMDMLVGAALKATGFSREQLDDGLAKGRAMIDDFERRLRNVEDDVGEILRLVRAINENRIAIETAKLTGGNAHAADVDDSRG